MRVGRKWPVEMNAGNLPVAGGAVFSSRGRNHRAPRANRIAAALHPLERANIAQPETLEAGQPESATGAGDVAEGITARVAIHGGVGGFADADTIQNDDRCAFHRRPSVYVRSTRDLSPVRTS